MTMPSRQQIQPVLLDVLRQWEGTPRASDVVAEVTRRFPQLTTTDFARVNKDGGRAWENRVRFARQDLVEQGLIDKSIRGVWNLTPTGAADADEGCSSVSSTETSTGDEASQPPSEGLDLEPISIVATTPELLVKELSEAAIDSSDSRRLERAVADAMRFFGFEVHEIGGSGNTDVLAIAQLGRLRYRVVIDAKSTSSNRVPNSQIDWLSIRKHREQEHAQHATIVGISFAEGQLQAHAEEFDVSLLTVSDLTELIELHVESPLSQVVLRRVFASSPFASTALPAVRSFAAATTQRLRLLAFVLEQIDHFNTVAPDDVIVKAENLWVTTLNVDELQGVTQLDVTNALHLLEIIGAIGKSNGDGYVSQTSKAGAVAMLPSLSNASRLETEEDMPGEDT